MFASKSLIRLMGELFNLDLKSDKQEEYDKLADKIMKDTKHITNVIKSPPNKYPKD